MANELTIENAQYEQLIKSNSAKALATELKLNDSQIAKANTSLLALIGDTKLQGASQLSKMRFAYRVATLNYKNPNAIAPIKYGNDIQAQLQYQAYIEDMLDCGGVVETNALPLFSGINYKAHINHLGFTELEIPERIELDNIFEKKEIIGYYAYAKCIDGRVATALMSNDEIEQWAKKYSLSYKNGTGIWKEHRETMALKTCIKKVARQVLKWYPFDRLSQSLELDQAVFTDTGISYKDNATQVKPINEINNKLVVDNESGEIKQS